MNSSTSTKSKFLSLILRHQPEKIGLALDPEGWAAVEELLSRASAHGMTITRAELDHIVATSEKKRFALSSDGLRIRANQGHSLEVDLNLQPLAPPESLFHGTVEKFLENIRAEGLLKGQRQHVHLAADRATAEIVGARRGRPVVLIVRSGDLARAGHLFYRSENGVWLTDHVPPAFLGVDG